MKPKPIIDPEYKEYVEQLPCLICGHSPKGLTRRIYIESTDEYKERPCKNNAHHVDNEMTRTKNDHRIVPECTHISISGRGTKDCHSLEHCAPLNGDKEHREWLIKMADEYYARWLELKEEIEERRADKCL